MSDGMHIYVSIYSVFSAVGILLKERLVYIIVAGYYGLILKYIICF